MNRTRLAVTFLVTLFLTIQTAFGHPMQIEPVSVVDTTAELLGRAKPRAPRARAGRSSVASAPSTTSRSRPTGTRKTAATKKPAVKKTASKSRKPANKNDDDFGNR